MKQTMPKSYDQMTPAEKRLLKIKVKRQKCQLRAGCYRVTKPIRKIEKQFDFVKKINVWYKNIEKTRS